MTKPAKPTLFKRNGLDQIEIILSKPIPRAIKLYNSSHLFMALYVLVSATLTTLLLYKLNQGYDPGMSPIYWFFAASIVYMAILGVIDSLIGERIWIANLIKDEEVEMTFRRRLAIWLCYHIG